MMMMNTVSRRISTSAFTTSMRMAAATRAFHSAPVLLQQPVNIQLVKQLRKETDAPLGQCKKALEESGGDMAAAKEWLRRKGVQLAQKKMGREALQGLVAVAVSEDGAHGAMVEVNSETDFVTRNEKFQEGVAQVVQVALDSKQDSVEELLDASAGEKGNLRGVLADLVGAIGENIQLRRAAIVKAEDGGVVGSYVHNPVGTNMGQMGALVAVRPAAADAPVDRAAMEGIARSVAMHVTAMMPRWMRREDVPADVIAKEESILRDKAVNEGKDAKFLDRVVQGQMGKFYQENVLLEQGWVMDDKVSVEKFLAQSGVTVTAYARFKTGQQEQEQEADEKAE